jgi:hypothetical protein
MTYRYNNRHRGNGARRTGGSRWMPLRYAGTCKVCQRTVPAGETAFYDAGARTVTCHAIECAKADGLTRSEWVGSPVSGSWVDTLAASRIGEAAPDADPFARTRSRGYYGRDAGRCEDAPCCGCCQ